MIILNVSKQLQHWFLLKEKKSDINFYDDVLGKKTHPVDGGGGRWGPYRNPIGILEIILLGTCGGGGGLWGPYKNPMGIL